MIALSIDRICRSVLATSSLRHGVGASRPALLEKDNLPALRRMAVDITARVLADLADRVISSDIESAGGAASDIVSTELDIAEAHQGLARAALEGAIAAGLLFVAYGEKSYSDEWRRYMTSLMLLRPQSQLPSRFYPDVV